METGTLVGWSSPDGKVDVLLSYIPLWYGGRSSNEDKRHPGMQYLGEIRGHVR